MIAGELISKSVLPLKLTDPVQVAINLFQDQKLSHLPVVDGFTYIGMASENDLLPYEYSGKTLEDFSGMFRKIFISPDLHLLEVFEAMIHEKTGIMPVAAENSEYVGAIVGAELIPLTGKLLSADNPGGIIELEVHENDYILSEIARIAEYNDAKILSLFITSPDDSKLLKITIKVNRIDLDPLLQTFERYSYKVVWSYSGDEASSLVKERFDSLKKFLEI